MDHEPTLGEIYRNLLRIEDRLNSRVVSLNTYQAEREADRDKVISLEKQVEKAAERQTWLFRAVVTSIIFPIVLTVTLVVLLGGTPP